MKKLVMDFVDDSYEVINDLNARWTHLKFVSTMEPTAMHDNVTVFGEEKHIREYLEKEYYGDSDDFSEEIGYYMKEVVEV